MIRFGRTAVTHVVRACLAIGVAALVAAPTASAATLHATPSTLGSAFGAAAGGDTIYLATGNYGFFAGGSKSSTVTLAAEPGAAVTFSPNFNGAAHIRLEGLTIPGGTIRASRDIQVVNSTITGIVAVFATVANAGITFDHDTLPNVNLDSSGFEGRLWINALNAPAAQPAGVTITNSVFDGGSADGVQLGGQANDVLIQGNVFRHLHTSSCSTCSDGYNHTDPIQIVGAERARIIGNYFQDVSTTVMAPEGGDYDLTIRDNVMVDVDQFCADLGYKPRLQFVHNTCVDSAPRLTDNHSGSTIPTTAAVFRDNVFGDGLVIGKVGSIAQEDYNLFGTGSGAGSHDIRARPQYVNANPAGPVTGYGLQPGSPGVSAASDGTNMGSALPYGTLSPPGATPTGPAPPQTDPGGSATGSGPTVTLTAPLPNSTVGRTIRFAARAASPNGISRVEFWVDSHRVATDTRAPYSASAHPSWLRSGMHTITARAFDRAGQAASSAALVRVSRRRSARTTTVHSAANGALVQTAAAAAGTTLVAGTAPKRRALRVRLTRCDDRRARVSDAARLRADGHGRVRATRRRSGLCVLSLSLAS
jgi:hypothetical protein